MNNFSKIYKITLSALLLLLVIGCKAPAIVENNAKTTLPEVYQPSASYTALAADTTNIAVKPWQEFYKDKYLKDLIDKALHSNQELNIQLQEIEIAKNDIRVKKGALLPSVSLQAGASVDKVGRYTSQGAGDANTEIEPGKEMPDPLGNFAIGAVANWEVDVWKKLRNSSKAAVDRYLATVEGKNFVVTNLVAEIANSYYELLALDNQLDIIRQTIKIQKNALEVVKIQKEAARSTELAVQKFQAEVLSTQNKEYEILQQIKETENKINFLLGRYPQEIPRDKSVFMTENIADVYTGIPSQLLANRPDIKQAELELDASKLDVKIARAEFFPKFEISAGVGLEAFKPTYLVKIPESLLYNLAADMAAPLINRNAIKAEFANANARQIQSLYEYEKTVLGAYLEVNTQISNIDNLQKNFSMQNQQVLALNKAIDAANDLFKAARADYFEVLMTQRDVLEAKLDLIETKQKQLASVVQIYRSLGGGWK